MNCGASVIRKLPRSVPTPKPEGGLVLAAVVRRWLQNCARQDSNLKVLVAFSGGIDSTALLHLLAGIRDATAAPAFALRAIHVDHQLHADSSLWARHCRRIARELKVPLSVRRVQVKAARGDSVEAVARDARYQVLRACLRAGEYLAVAQHADDQLETFLLALMRGSGVAGLAAMPASMPFGRGTLCRPLLDSTRAQLQQYVERQRLPCIEDASNSNLRFDRNFLRARVLPALRERWPSVATAAVRSAKHLGEASDLLRELAAEDLERLRATLCGEPASAAAYPSMTGNLPIAKFAQLSTARQRNVLREWLRLAAVRPPDRVHLERIRVELLAARADANPFVAWDGVAVRRFGAALWITQAPNTAAEYELRDYSQHWSWRRGALRLPAGLGALTLRAAGRRAAMALPARLEVRFRSGGERLRREGDTAHRALKDVLREAQVPPWMRGRVPLIYAKNELLVIPGIWCKVRAPLWRIDWRQG